MAEPLTTDMLLDMARKQAGLDDFGDEYFRESLDKLLSCVQKEVAYTPSGWNGFIASSVGLLVNRLRIVRDLKAHPEILDEDVSDPIIILGLVRTGTSKLQMMMAADPRFRALQGWQAYFPGRIVESNDPASDPRPEMAREMFAALHRNAPEFSAGHPMFADQTEEETRILHLSFSSWMGWVSNPSDSFYEWAKAQDESKSYEFFVKVLKYLQWQEGGRRGRRQVLKTPMHLRTADLLVKYFPKATLVHCHRQPADFVRSWVRLQDLIWQMSQEKTDPARCRRSALEVWGDALKKFLAYREEMGSDLNVVDVYFEEIRDDPIKAISRVYAAAGVELTPESEAAMLAWNAAHPPHRAGKMEYHEELYGVTPEMVDTCFADYLAKFY